MENKDSIIQEVNQKVIDVTERALEKKYGKKFVVTHIGDRVFKTTTKLFARVDETDSFPFTVIVKNDYQQIEDDYCYQLLLHRISSQIEKIYLQNGVRCCVKGYLQASRELFKTDSLLKNMIDEYKIPLMMFRVILDKNIVSKKIVDKQIEAILEQYNILCVFNVFVMGTNYEECSKYFRDYPEVSEDEIKEFQPIDTFSYLINER